MRAWITGITGFLGSHLAEHMLQQGDEVLGTSRRGTWPPWLKHLAREVPLWSWDLGREEPPPELWHALGKFQPQVVFHLAALSVPRACGDREPTQAAWAVNVEGTRRVCQVAWELRPRPLLVLASSAHVYARPPHGGYVVRETDPVNPSGGYGRSKLQAEQVLGEFARRGLAVVIVRSFNHAGPRQSPRLMLSQWARQLAQGTACLEVYNLDTWLDLLDVQDAARAYRTLGLQGRSGVVYNLGAGSAVRTGWVLELLMSCAGYGGPCRQLRPGQRRNLVADTARVRGLGWWPRVPLAQTVQRTWEFWTRWADAFPA